MSWIIIAVVIIISVLIIAAIFFQKHSEQTKEYPYEKLGVLFTPAERSFLGVLNQVVSDKAQVFGKVRVADIIAPIKGMSRSEWQKGFIG